jgi:hypothetical protein
MARVKISLGGFKDAQRRPRWIVWTVVVVILFAAFMIPVLGVTSTRWFCSEGCHKVQDDTITSYQHSAHSEISCMACHMPVNANPVIFLIHKAEALGELVQTVTNNYELPLNAESEVALTMKSAQCTQCHIMQNRTVSPSEGIKIDHAIHTENEVTCTTCHNRTAHVEDFTLTLTNPKTGEPNKKHENFMEMTACFRCHTQEPRSTAPGGQCFLCHTQEFDLLPKSHEATSFFPKGHGTLALAEEKRAPWMNATATADAETAKTKEVTKEERYAGENIPAMPEVNLCSTCHSKAFCTDCHGVPMPHPKDFKKSHGTYGKANPQVCAKCHGQGTDFCNECHHGQAIGYKYVPSLSWKQQHPAAVAKTGSAACLKCHNPTYCAVCHVTGKPPANTN